MKISIPHKLRKLKIKERLKIPSRIFDIGEQEIERIRKLESGKERLIESAKLQYKLFKDIHNDLTAWISGYADEQIIRQKFGSARNLHNYAIPNKNNQLANWQDFKKNIKIPSEPNEFLAEEIGIHIGDGNLFTSFDKKGNSTGHRYSICGHLIDDYIYHTEYLKGLLEKVYGSSGSIRIQKNRNSIASVLHSKSIVDFKNKTLGLPMGKKTNITIPKIIIKEDAFLKRCIVGIIDTDFTFSRNMLFVGNMSGIPLMKQLSHFLNKLNIKHAFVEQQSYCRIRITKADSIKIFEEWGINNEKHISKYNLWKEFKLYLPFTTTPERLAVLSSKLDIEELVKLSKKRRLINKNRLAEDFRDNPSNFRPPDLCRSLTVSPLS